MKTISEAKSDYVISISDDILTNQDIIEQRMDSFDAGVEFCQTWIPVEEELPEVECVVLVKGVGRNPIRCCALFTPNDKKFTPDFLITNEQVTHWRPIERK